MTTESRIVKIALEFECPTHHKETTFHQYERDGMYECQYPHCQSWFSYEELVKYNLQISKTRKEKDRTKYEDLPQTD